MRLNGQLVCGAPGCGSARARGIAAHPRAFNRRSLRPLTVVHKDSGCTPEDEVYVVRLPLVGLEMVVDMLPAGLSSAGALHVAVLVVRPETVADRYWIFDFLPIEPLKQETILNIVAGRPVKAQTRNRVVTKSAPLKRCKLIGPSLHGDTIQVAKSFQEDWPKLLAVGKMDCRHHAKALIKELTGVEVDYIV